MTLACLLVSYLLVIACMSGYFGAANALYLEYALLMISAASLCTALFLWLLRRAAL